MNIRPLHDRMVVRRLEDAKTSPGGIVVPDSAAGKPTRGEVLAVGPGSVLANGDIRACDVKAGDKVLFGQYSGSAVRIEDEDLLMLSESEVLGVLEG